MMPYTKERMIFKRQPREVTLNVSLPCTICNSLNDNPTCQGHDAGVEDVKITVVGIPWARLNYIRSQAVSFNDDKTYFDGSYYINECLKQMIIEAPWGKTDDIFLLQVNTHLGKALERIVPKATTDDKPALQQDFSEIKKE